MLKVIGIALTSVISAGFLKKMKPEIAMGITILAAIMIACFTLTYLTQYQTSFTTLDKILSENGEYLQLLIKMIGITYICEFSADVCKDAGYQTVAGQVDIFGKCLVLFSGLPILEQLLNTILSM